MGWDGSHLHTFEIGGRYYGDPDAIDDVVNEERLTMNTVAKSAGRRFNYTYDFGDNWQHEIVIEGKKPLVDGRGYPSCIAGKRNCPPEDCGGRSHAERQVQNCDDGEPGALEQTSSPETHIVRGKVHGLTG